MQILFLVCTLLFQVNAFAQNVVAEIAVGNAELDKDKFVIDDAEISSLNGPQKNLASELIEILRNDFIFYKHKFNNVEYC